jgi:hypothetical protein
MCRALLLHLLMPLLLLHSWNRGLGNQPSLPHTYLPGQQHHPDLGLFLLLVLLLLLPGLCCLVGVAL